MKVVIRAGGVGSRLWPVSREGKPKQLHALTSEKTMLQESLERVFGLVKPEDIYISSNIKSEKAMRKELGAILESHLIVIVEPARRDTAAAIGLESVYIAKNDPNAIVASLGSDHIITKEKEFHRLLKLAEKEINKKPDEIICLGIKPSYPDTGYGYIELGKKRREEIFQVNSFREKPNKAKAKDFLEAGNYLWNANMFIWRVDTILALYKIYLPEMYEQLMIISESIGTNKERQVLEDIYPKLEKIAVDYAIIEKAENILAIPADIGWNDIGDWARLKDELSKRETDNVIKAEHIGIDTKNTLVFSETKKLITTIGLENLLIVETEDALLICDKYRSQDVKKIIDELKKQNKKKYL